MSLSNTQRAILTAAAQHPEHLGYPPERLPAGARQKVAQALLKQDLVIGVHRPAYDAIAKWTVEGEEMLLKITDDGLRAIGIDPSAGDAREQDEQSAAAEAATPEADTPPTGGEEEAPQDEDAPVPEATHGAPVAPTPRASLRDAAAAVLAAWDDDANRETDIIGALDGPMEALRALLATKPARAIRDPATPRKPREGTKQEQVLTMLHRPEGATIAQIVDATGWQQHTVRGFFAGLKKRQGIAIEVMERVRQVGPDKQGAKGSYSIYRIAMPADRRHGSTPRYAVGLYRVSTAEQGHSGLGLEAQQASVRAFVASQGWVLVAEHSDIASGKDDRRTGFQAALMRCRQIGAVLVAARLDRITRRAHTLSQLLEDGVSIRAADMPGADDLMMRVYAAMAQKERELISERTRVALAAAKARGKALGGDRGYRPVTGPDAAAAAQARREAAERAAHRLHLALERLRAEGVHGHAQMARTLSARAVPTPRGSTAWTHTTVARVLRRAMAAA